jgi:hypothetical protein
MLLQDFIGCSLLSEMKWAGRGVKVGGAPSAREWSGVRVGGPDQ